MGSSKKHKKDKDSSSKKHKHKDKIRVPSPPDLREEISSRDREIRERERERERRHKKHKERKARPRSPAQRGPTRSGRSEREEYHSDSKLANQSDFEIFGFWSYFVDKKRFPHTSLQPQICIAFMWCDSSFTFVFMECTAFTWLSVALCSCFQACA